MEKVFNLIAIASIHGTIVGLVLIAVKSLLNQRLNAKWHYFIWMILILKLIMPFGPESALSLFNVVPEINYSDEGVLPYSFTQQYQAQYENQQGLSGNPLENEVAEPTGEISINRWMSYLWAGGSLAILLWLSLSFWLLDRRLRKCSHPVDERLERLYSDCKVRMGITQNIPLSVQDVISMPSLFGLFKPQILLSPSVAHLSAKELEYILLHELAHYKRKDIFMNYLLLILQAIHWFNPIMWFYFKRIRQDMEVAADEHVLSLLEKSEHKNYGKALISILESFAAPSLAPRLLAMSDDKKGIERRIQMIKMAEFFKGRRKLILVVGLLCIALLSSLLLTDGITEQNANADTMLYNTEKLFNYKTPYVGDNAKVGNIIGSLPYAESVSKISLQTKTKPYGITVDYEFSDEDKQKEFMDHNDPRKINNAAILFSLIDNVDVVQFNVLSEKEAYRFERSFIQSSFEKDLRQYSKDVNTFNGFLRSLILKVVVTPDKYSPAMSSTPGMKIMPIYLGNEEVHKVIYSTQKGVLFTWGETSGKISERKQMLEVPMATSVYWSPLGDKSTTITGKQHNIVAIALLDKNNRNLAETQIIIQGEDLLYYHVKSSSGVLTKQDIEIQEPRSLDEAVNLSL